MKDKLERFAKEVEKKKYTESSIAAVEKNGALLKQINPEKLDTEVYTQLCIKAVKQKWLALKYINAEKIDTKSYQKLCIRTVKKDWRALKHINAEKLPKAAYQLLCTAAIKRSYRALRFISATNLDEAEYRALCIEALAQNEGALVYVQAEKLNKAVYQELCTKAVEKDVMTLRNIKVQQLPPGSYEELCTAAVKKDWKALECVAAENLYPKEYQALCTKVIEKSERGEFAIQEVSIELLLKNKALLTYAISYYPLTLTQIRVTEENRHVIIDSILDVGVEKIISENARLIPILRSIMANNFLELEKIKAYIARVDNIVVTKSGFSSSLIYNPTAFDYEKADSYHIYAAKREEKGTKFIHVEKNDLPWLLKERNYDRGKSPVSLVLLGHSNAHEVELAGLSMEDVAVIVEENPSINRVVLLGCYTAQANPLEEEAKMIEKFKVIEAEKNKTPSSFFLASLSKKPLSTDTLKFPKEYLEGYILNKKGDASYELVYVVGKKITQYHELNATQLDEIKKLLKPRGKFNFPRKKGQLNTLSVHLKWEQQEKLVEIVGENPYAESDYKDSKTYLPYLTALPLKPAEKYKLQESLMKQLVSALEKKITDTRRSVQVKGYTKAVHVDTSKAKRLHVADADLFKGEYKTEFYKSKKDNINRSALFKARKKERNAMREGTHDKTLAKAVKMDVTKKP